MYHTTTTQFSASDASTMDTPTQSFLSLKRSMVGLFKFIQFSSIKTKYNIYLSILNTTLCFLVGSGCYAIGNRSSNVVNFVCRQFHVNQGYCTHVQRRSCCSLYACVSVSDLINRDSRAVLSFLLKGDETHSHSAGQLKTTFGDCSYRTDRSPIVGLKWRRAQRTPNRPVHWSKCWVS